MIQMLDYGPIPLDKELVEKQKLRRIKNAIDQMIEDRRIKEMMEIQDEIGRRLGEEFARMMEEDD
jgi:hypothetical protein